MTTEQAEIARLNARVTELLRYNNEQVELRRQMARAGRELYLAGRWSCDRPVDEAQLWENLRDAVELPIGAATAAVVGMINDQNPDGSETIL
jgi:hypothetical protein